jgi:hypothetical protein
MRVASLDVQPVDRDEWMRSGPDHAIPTQFRAVARLIEPLCDVTFEVAVEVKSSAPVIKDVRVQRIEDRYVSGPGITASRLHRIVLDALLRDALLKVREPIIAAPDTDGWTGRFQLQSDAEAGNNRTYGGRRVGATPDEYLRRVADVYRGAIAAGTPPVVAVQRDLNISRSHAGRLVGDARASGYLAPTTPGKVRG